LWRNRTKSIVYRNPSRKVMIDQKRGSGFNVYGLLHECPWSRLTAIPLLHEYSYSNAFFWYLWFWYRKICCVNGAFGLSNRINLTIAKMKYANFMKNYRVLVIACVIKDFTRALVRGTCWKYSEQTTLSTVDEAPCCARYTQARRQDLAAGGQKTKRGAKNQKRGPHF